MTHETIILSVLVLIGLLLAGVGMREGMALEALAVGVLTAFGILCLVQSIEADIDDRRIKRREQERPPR